MGEGEGGVWSSGIRLGGWDGGVGGWAGMGMCLWDMPRHVLIDEPYERFAGSWWRLGPGFVRTFTRQRKRIFSCACIWEYYQWCTFCKPSLACRFHLSNKLSIPPWLGYIAHND